MRVKWETVAGTHYEGEVVKAENDGDGMMVAVRLDNGAIKSVEAEYLCEA